jgi:hypothetical protein
MRTRLQRLILLALNAADGMPLPETALVAAVQIASRPDEPTFGDVNEALRDAEGRRWVTGLSDELTGKTWTLTESGKHKARQLRG